MELWNRARSFAEEAAKLSQELLLGLEATKLISETAAKASKHWPQPSIKNDFDIHHDTELCDVPAVSNIRQDLTEWQKKHASLILSTVEEISRLSYENQYTEDDKLKSSEQIKDHKVMMKPLNTELIYNQEVQEVKEETKSSKSSTEQDLDVFLLGEGNSHDECDDDDGGYDDLDKLMDSSDDEKGKSYKLLEIIG
ncbi:hypothetical protein VNO78_23656 [Psophocarpus tetragonolobus]|uniref:Uncharacterized protein n=1 Tax=Psophocarpus tetragonolobus TaxID=3891 RepID=A0AAN9XEL8_PSOTE